MPLSPEKIKETKEWVTLSRKRELNFGLCMGKKPDGMLMLTDKIKTPPALGKKAKAEGETKQFTFGKLSSEGKELTMVVEGKIHPGMSRKMREYLKAAGATMKVFITDPEGNQVEGGDDEDSAEAGSEENTEAASGGAADATGDAAQQSEAGGEAGEDTSTGQPEDTPAGQPVVVGNEPEKRDLLAEFTDVRKDLMRNLGQLGGDAQTQVQDGIKQFGEMMKARDYKGAQDLMDDLSVAQGSVVESQRGRARDDIAQIDGMVGDIETELDAIEAALSKQETSA